VKPVPTVPGGRGGTRPYLPHARLPLSRDRFHPVHRRPENYLPFLLSVIQPLPVAKETTRENRYGRRAPASGAHLYQGQLNVFFLTVCAKNHVPWMHQAIVLQSLVEIWRTQATAWWVGEFLIMPDHLHLFCAPHDLSVGIDTWIKYWKSCFTRSHLDRSWTFQRRGFHHRLRTAEEYRDQWHYVRLNPVRAGLVADADSWPFKGRVHLILGGA